MFDYLERESDLSAPEIIGHRRGVINFAANLVDSFVTRMYGEEIIPEKPDNVVELYKTEVETAPTPARQPEIIELDDSTPERVDSAREWVDKLFDEGESDAQAAA